MKKLTILIVMLIFLQIAAAIDSPEMIIYAGENKIGNVGETIKFEGEAVSIDGDIILYEWDFEGDGIFDYNSSLSNATHIYSAEGTYKASLRATDNIGNSETDFVEIKIYFNKPPRPKAAAVTSTPADGITKYYVLFIVGSGDSMYWSLAKDVYSDLKNKYDLSDDEIYFLHYEERNDTPEIIIDDLSTKENIELTIKELGSIMDKDDVLLLMINSHGGGYYGEEAYRPAYHGFSYSTPTIEPGDEKDYVERDFKLRSLYTGGDYRANHGMEEWKLKDKYVRSWKKTFFERKIYFSTFDNITLEDGTSISDDDIFIEEITDYLLGDLDKNGVIEDNSTEFIDYDNDGIEGYDPDTGLFDEDDWGLPDKYKDNFNRINTRKPGGKYCLFDDKFDNKIDIDLNCKCEDLDECDISLLEVDGTDIDGEGLFDGIDVNDDGDMNDWVSLDETVCLNGADLIDDELQAYLENLDVKNVVVVINTCFAGGFVDDLSKEGTIVMTCTVEEDVGWGAGFPREFRKALSYPGADKNHDFRVSVAEAFNFAVESDGSSQKSQYDDNGDAISHTSPIPNSGDGEVGANLFLFNYTVSCSTDSQCGKERYLDNFCDGKSLYRKKIVPTCFNGTEKNFCGESEVNELLLNCVYGCKDAHCTPNLCKDVKCESYCDGFTFYMGLCAYGECEYSPIENSPTCGYEEPGDGDSDDNNQSETSTIDLQLVEASDYYPSGTLTRAGEERIFTLLIEAHGDRDISGVNWMMNTSEGVVRNEYPFTIQKEDRTLIFVDAVFEESRDHELTFIVDPDNNIKEYDEGNNKRSFYMRIG